MERKNIEIYKSDSMVGMLSDIEMYINANHIHQGIVKINADVFNLIGEDSVFPMRYNEGFKIDEAISECNKFFYAFNRKDIAVVYVYSRCKRESILLTILVNKLHLEGYEEVYINFSVPEYWNWETIEAL